MTTQDAGRAPWIKNREGNSSADSAYFTSTNGSKRPIGIDLSTAAGQYGSYAEKPGYDFIFQGQGALMSINGEAHDTPGGGPMKASIAITDVLTGLNASKAILAAIESRHHTGSGQKIDVSLLDMIAHLGSNPIVSHFTRGEVPERRGDALPNLAPYQSFATSAPPVRAQHIEDILREVFGIRAARIQAPKESNAVEFVTKTH